MKGIAKRLPKFVANPSEPIPGLGSPDVAEEFFNVLFGRVLALRDEYIALAAMDHKTGRFQHVFCSNIMDATGVITDLYLRKLDVYCAVHPRFRPSRKRNSIKTLIGVHVDADKLSRRSYERLLRLHPTLLISSSSFAGSLVFSRHKRSFHGYLLFKDPVGMDRADTVLKLNKRLAEILNVDSQTADLTRILRVPRTLNFKKPSDPRPVDIVEWHPERRYTIEEIAEMLQLDISEPKAEPGSIIPKEPAVITPSDPLEVRSRFLNAEQRLYISRLLREGLFERGSRNKAQLLLTMHFYELGYSRERIINELKSFFRDRHNGYSADWIERPDWVLENIGRGVDNWLKKAILIPEDRAGTSKDRKKALGRDDIAFIQKQRLSSRDKAFLSDAMEWILNNHRCDRVIMSVRQMYKFRFCNERNYKTKRQLLYNLGIISLDVMHDRDTGLAYEYKVLYRFAPPMSGKHKRSRQTIGDQIEGLILEGKSNAEIRQQLPNITRQRIQSKRQTLDKRSRQGYDS